MVAMPGTSFAANMQGGLGNTGNKDNRPAVIQKGSHLSGLFGSAKSLPWCTSTRTHNCRHHATNHMTHAM
jgi:hypothetical protein